MTLPDWEREKQIAIEAFENFAKPNPGGCASCAEGCPVNECPNSNRSCGHHCDCSWIFDKCCWCGAVFGDQDDPNFGVPQLEPTNYRGPGKYKHYKGGEYMVLGLALHEHGKDHNPDWNPLDEKFHQVIYTPLTEGSSLFGSPATMWIRNLKSFNQHVRPEPDSDLIPRFVKMDDA